MVSCERADAEESAMSPLEKLCQARDTFLAWDLTVVRFGGRAPEAANRGRRAAYERWIEAVTEYRLTWRKPLDPSRGLW